MASLISPPAVGAAGDPMTPKLAQVAARRRETADVWTLELDADGLGRAEPGQFNMLTAFGVGEAAISLSGETRDRLIHTIRAVGPVSTALANIRAGDPIGVRGPFGVGWPMRQAVGRDVVVIAGGLGLAPLRPALRRLAAERARYAQVVLLYGARSPQDILFLRELESWRRRLDMQVLVTVDHAGDDWRGHVGLVTTLLARASFDPANTVAMICGPEIMMRFCAAALEQIGVAAEAVFLSMERSMKCAIGHCGHCQFGPVFVCRDGPVFPQSRIGGLLRRKEI